MGRALARGWVVSEAPCLRMIRMPAAQSLDPIDVFLVDDGPGRGSITITCYGSAWTAWWGSMGDRSVAQFVAGCDAAYLCSKLRSEVTKASKDRYLLRVAAAVHVRIQQEIGGGS